MVKKLDDATSKQNNVSEVDPQKKYLMDQFGSLMDQVGDGFGGPLQEELIRRLEQTIADFHQEVNEMLTNLKESSEKRHEKLKEIWENPEQSSQSEEASITTEVDESASDWEKRVEGMESEGGDDQPKEEEPKKKGLFGRGKK